MENPPAVDAIASALRVLLGVSGAASLTLWSADAGTGTVELVAAAGDPSQERRSALGHDAGELLAGRTPEARHLSAAVLHLPDGSRALLLADDPRHAAGTHDGLLRAARPTLAGLIRRRAGSAPHAEVAAAETAAAERQLQRLRFDLHDGPQQEIHLLAQDLRRFRDQLRPMIDDHPDRDRALGRLDDLEAQLIALDDDLRRLAGEVRSPLLSGSLAQALLQVAESFSLRTGIVPRTELVGDIEAVTESQQIALLSVIREALTNVRLHAEAGEVAISIDAGEERIDIEVRDDGDGFDPEVTGPRAAQAGHLGLVGMHERMRMLGGRTEIHSAPGGPTVVAATLPRWPVQPQSPTDATP